MERYLRSSRGVALAIVGDVAAAEDVAQDAATRYGIGRAILTPEQELFDRRVEALAGRVPDEIRD